MTTPRHPDDRPMTGRARRRLPLLTGLRPADPAHPLRRDVMPAGRVLVLLVSALAMAAVINSGRQAQRASQMPLGEDRDRALAIWEPINEVAYPLGLQGPRSLLEVVRFGESRSYAPTSIAIDADDGTDAAGGEVDTATGSTTTSVASTTTTTKATTTTAPPRQATAAEPLRVLLVGDSTMEAVGTNVQRLLADTGVAFSEMDYKPSSGFSRPDFFDWPVHLEGLIGEQNPEVIIAMYGANDAQGFVVDGAVQDFGTEGWIETYGDRVQAGMEIMAADGRRVFFIGQPRMRSDTFDAKMSIINTIYQERAELVPGVEFVSSSAVLTPSGYEAYGTSVDGSERLLRAQDGIHLTGAGGQLMAAAVVEDLRTAGLLPPASTGP